MWGIAAVMLGIAAVCLTGPLGSWLSRTLWTAHPQHPMSLLEETTLVGGWREMESQPAPRMLSIPFHLNAGPQATNLESITVENTSSAPVRNVWFYRDGMPNFYDTQSIVESVTAGKTTETEKVLALWELSPAYYYNYNPLSCDGLRLDPPTLLAVLGTA